MYENRAGLSNLNQPRAANCQLSLLTGHKSVANHTNVNRPRPVSLYHYQSGEKERKTNKQTNKQNKTKKHKLSNTESKYYDLEFLSTLFHIFINLKLGQFYFDSLAGRMKLPRGPHAARGPQVGKPWHTVC